MSLKEPSFFTKEAIDSGLFGAAPCRVFRADIARRARPLIAAVTIFQQRKNIGRRSNTCLDSLRQSVQKPLSFRLKA